ncbi:MAG: hypothetical protein J4472_00130 [DPANN group archaeon]|nr:hypothetical protein [DPANN group archaeon]
MVELQPIKARIIVEVAGWPEDHIKHTLDLVKSKFGGEGIKVEKATIREPKKISDKAYSGFVEFEFTVKKLTDLIGIVFDWMPSTVEIFEPAELADTNFNFTNLLNDMTTKLHQYDALIKKLKATNTLMQRDLQRLNNKLVEGNDKIKKLKKDVSTEEELNDVKDSDQAPN